MFHGKVVHARRVRVLAAQIATMIPQTSSVLDIGCGDGALDHLLLDRRPDLSIQGVDVLARESAAIPVTLFDGVRLPFADASVDYAMFVDVLHHTDDPMVLLREAARVARRGILIKDHLCHGFGARTTLRLMDWIGNARHGVRLPYNYWPGERWGQAFAEIGVNVVDYRDDLSLYPIPADWIFGSGLQFIARLEFVKNPAQIHG